MKILSVLTAAAILSAVFFFSSCTPEPEIPEETKPPVNTAEAFEKTYFLGDSNTAHLAHSSYKAICGLVLPSHILTGSGGTLMLDLGMQIIDPESKEPISVSDAAEKYNPAYLLITLGYNGYAFSENLDTLFCRAYEKLINSIKTASPQTSIIIQSIFPVRAGTAINDPDRVNARIDTLNSQLIKIASENGVKYLDTQSILRDENGHLRAEYSCEGSIYHADGYHLSDTGLLAVINYIKSNAYGD
ncbi:MAG: hypothetical protein E7640_03790 [Ruminococcaceae bacterium]|nr:hypothetical protein [Oscillospiraceae bacterium]